MSKQLWAVVAVGFLAACGVGGYFVYTAYFGKKEPDPVKVPVGPTEARKAVPVPDVKFTDVTEATGIKFTHVTGATGNKLLPETMGAGVVVLDFDNDKKPDLLFVNSCPWPGHPAPAKAPCLALYRNKGDGTFEDVTELAGLNVTLYGVGACAGDFDNDGFIDLFVTCVGKHRLFRNIDGKRFEDVTDKAGVGGLGVWPGGESAAGFLTHRPAIPFGSSATFVDYDGDGKLDLFVCHYCTWSPDIDLNIAASLIGGGVRTYQQPKDLDGSLCSLYRNKGNGTFEDVSEAAGVRVVEAEGTDANARKRPVAKALGVILYDADGDGWPDLIVANDTVRNFFLHNVPDGKGGRKFEEKGQSIGAAYAENTPRGAMGIDVGEYRPGKSGVLITNFANEPNTLLVLSNPARLLFADTAAAVGMGTPSKPPLKFGAFFFDYDLDGRLDILTANGHIDPDIQRIQSNQKHKQPAQLFWNTGDEVRVYEPVPEAGAGDLFKPIVGRGSAYLDFDGDGDLDVVLTENGGPALLLRNDQTTGHHWIRLDLQGDGKTSNRSAIGAEVTVEAGGTIYKRTITGTKGYLSQSELTVTVGLGTTAKVDKVTVRWPGKAAASETWTGLAVDKLHTLVQGTAK